MSQLVTQLVFHPKISQSLRVWSTTIGRDKTYRAIQYFARFYAWFLLKRGNTLSAVQWNSLKSALASGRKMLRLFKPLEHLQAALATPASPFQFEYVASVARQLSYAGYLAYDAIVWANAVKFITLDKEAAVRVNRISQRFWLAGILFSIGGGLSKYNRQVNSIQELKRVPKGEKSEAAQVAQDELKVLRTQTSAVRYQLLQDLLDVWLPASNLDYVSVNDGLAGIIGLITSLMAFNLQWKAAAIKK